MYTIRKPRFDELDVLVDFITAAQARPDSRCLHLDWTPEGIRADVQDLDEPFQEAFRFACEGETIVGVLGGDIDVGAGRAWLHGPFARDRDWDLIVEMLCDDLWQRLPASVGRVSNYIELANARALDQHARRGFVRKGLSHIYRADGPPAQPEVRAGIRPFALSDADRICELHAAAFPQTWISGPEMISKIDATHPLLIASANGEAAGYLRLSRHASLPEASVDFVAVAESQRGKGLGRQLLLAALDWIFREQGLSTAFLNVSDDNVNAKQLYESAGFRLFQSGVALDWWGEGSRESHKGS